MKRRLRYHRERVAFLWRLGNAWPYRVACILGLVRSPSWETHRTWSDYTRRVADSIEREMRYGWDR